MDDPLANTDLDGEEVQRFRSFFESLTSSKRPQPDTLWHYTSAAGLIGILESGTLFATHVSCLNDTLEYRYLAQLLGAEAGEQSRQETDPVLRELYELSAESLGARDVTTASAFVTCFSNAKDDLGQWRGYGSGDCAFAIEFSTAALLEGMQRRSADTYLLRMDYDEDEHRSLAKILVSNLGELYQRSRGRTSDQEEQWHKVFGVGYGELTNLMHARVKHPKFQGEKEYRIFTKLLTGEHAAMEFRAKRTLLSRHIALRLGADGRLPIRSVMVGPGGAQAVSKVSVSDLLKKQGYDDLPVYLSEIPYRAV